LGNFDAVLALATCPFRGSETKPLRKNFISHPAYWIDQNQGVPKVDPADWAKVNIPRAGIPGVLADHRVEQ
jgi:hypothetical protein